MNPFSLTKYLKVWQKFVVLGAVVLIAFGAVTWQWIGSVKTEDLTAARTELAGVNYFAPLRTVLKALQQYRDLGHAYASGDTALRERADSKALDVENSLSAMNETDRAKRAVLQSSRGWGDLVEAWRNHLAQTNRPPAAELFDQRTKLIETAFKLMTDVGDSSGLNRDNDEIRGNLNDALQFRLPELTEQLSKARGLALGIAARKTASQTDLDRLKDIAASIEKSVIGTDGVLGRAANNAPGLNDLLAMFRKASAFTTNECVATLNKIIAAPNDAQSVDALFDTFTKNINAHYAVADECGRALDAFLKFRETQLRRESAQLLFVWVVPFFLVLLVFGLAIMHDITRPLKQVVSIADRIAAGDLAVNIPADHNRRDEMGELIRSFNRMSESLSTLVGHVQQSGVSVNTSVTHIAATGKEQQNTADAIVRATTELGATAKEISTTSRELLNTMNSVASVAEGTAQLAGSGREGLARMENMVKQITDATAVVAANFRALSDKAANINQVVTTITKIADRTNLLSLNAAIEAEKAGEYGRGFSVVATEIRRLADQTAVATYDIEQMVKEIQSAIPAGVLSIQRSAEEVRRGADEVQRVSAQLAQIIQQVQTLTPRFEAVNDKMRSQAAGGEQISERLAQLSRAVQQTAQSLQQSNQTIEQLRAAAYGLREGVARFKLPE